VDFELAVGALCLYVCKGWAARGGGWMVMFAQAFRLQPHTTQSNEVERTRFQYRESRGAVQG
jgi:hypothetical protein